MFKTMKKILKWSGDCKKNLYIGMIFSFLATCCTAVPIITAAWVLSEILAEVQGEKALDAMLAWKALFIIAASVVLRGLFSYVKASLQESFGTVIAAEERIRIGDILKRVSMGYFQKNSAGEVLSVITKDLSGLELQGPKLFDAVINGYVNFAAILVCMGIFCYPAALAALAGGIISYFALRAIDRHSTESAVVSQRAAADLNDSVISYIRGLPVVKAFGQSSSSLAGINQACADSKNINLKIVKGFVPSNCIHLLALRISSVVIVLIAAWMTLEGNMQLPVLFLMMMFSFFAFGGVESINDAAHMLGIAESALNKLAWVENTEFIDEDGAEIKPDSYDIVFDKVSFAYEQKEIIHQVSFQIPENTTLAIVGPSGSGKSTLCKLLARFYDVSGGRILVGGHNVKEFTCDSLLSNISMVFQNVYLFHDTVWNNIAFGKENATEEEVIEAAKKARCHDFIMELPDGYQTMVGEGGGSLSGGEKQRISIARAILKNAPIIILDEATASIDPENEFYIQQAIAELTAGKTIIVIAHRLATIEKADRILVLQDGSVIQTGKHEELLAEEGLYKDFIAVREKAAGWSLHA